MPEDRSLDEFAGEAGETDEADGETDASSAATADSQTHDADPTENPDPATPTADWTADGAACERCGATVERRWLDDGDRVCADCKAW